MEIKVLYEMLDNLNNIEVHGKGNIARLLVCINKIEQIINENMKEEQK